jgi:hypothetical protein
MTLSEDVRLRDRGELVYAAVTNGQSSKRGLDLRLRLLLIAFRPSNRATTPLGRSETGGSPPLNSGRAPRHQLPQANRPSSQDCCSG